MHGPRSESSLSVVVSASFSSSPDLTMIADKGASADSRSISDIRAPGLAMGLESSFLEAL
jgi:hypothetical protein